MKRSLSFLLAAALIVFSGMLGCVSKTYIDQQNQKMMSRIQTNEREISSLKDSTAKQLGELSNTVQEAMQRADEASVLAKGTFLYEVTLSDESVFFAFGRSTLSDEAKAALDVFALNLKEKNRNVYIEIQGHTDNTGDKAYNMFLGQSRGKIVLDFLYLEHGIPLHRMRAFSYGDTKPVVENDSVENRAKNRRVTIVVME